MQVRSLIAVAALAVATSPVLAKDIVQTEGPVTNALPLRLTPLPEGWKLEPLS